MKQIKPQASGGSEPRRNVIHWSSQTEKYLADRKPEVAPAEPPRGGPLINLRRFIERAQTIADSLKVPKMNWPSELGKGFADISLELQQAKYLIASLLSSPSPALGVLPPAEELARKYHEMFYAEQMGEWGKIGYQSQRDGARKAGEYLAALAALGQ